jgi:hypothetical protein
LDNAYKDAFDEEVGVFIESNSRASRLIESTLESEITAVEETWREGYFTNGYYDPPFYVEEEQQDDFDGEEGEEPPMVWVVKNSHYTGARQSYYGTYETEREAQNAADEANREDEWKAASEYLGNNYREIKYEALTNIVDNIREYDFYDDMLEMWRETQDEQTLADIELEATRAVFLNLGQAPLFDRINSAGVSTPVPTFPPTKWGSYTLVKGDNYRELLLTLASHKGAPFTHPTHWGSNQNMLAHVRFSEVDGVLVIEEIQSDWHQQGRDKGYKNMAALDALTAKRDAALNAYDDALRQLARDLNAKSPEDGDGLYDNYAASYETMRTFHDMLVAMPGLTLSENVAAKYAAAEAKLAEAKQLRQDYLNAKRPHPGAR